MPDLVIDLEGTCDDRGSIPDSEREIIEIGAVAMSDDVELFSYSALVKPVRHPRLTAFCTQLTGITQSDVDRELGFVDVWRDFLAWKQSHDLGPTFYSWGTFDRDAIRRDTDFNLLQNPFRHVDLAAIFTKHTHRRMGHRKAMKHLGVAADGRHHRGIDDARNVAKLLLRLKGEGWLLEGQTNGRN